MSRAFNCVMIDHEIGNNLKLGRLTDSEFRAFVAGVLPIAAKSHVRGALLVAPEVPATADDVARQAGVKPAAARSALRKLRELRCLVHDDELGAEWVHDFEDYNPEPKRDSTAAKRARDYRARQKAKRHATVTAPSRRDGRNANARDTPPEVEGEEEDRSYVATPTDQGASVVALSGDREVA